MTILGEGGWRGLAASRALRDGLFLAVAVVFSAALYLPGLGLYSDDWALLALMHHAPDGSLPGLYESLLPTGIGTRPLQAMWLAVLFSLFGLEPLGYHVANTAMLAAIVVLFSLCLRGLGFPRILAVAAALIFAVLPHYSTGRVWIAAFQAPLSVLLYLCSLYADLRYVRTAHWIRWAWKLAGTMALLASVLAYEITAGLFLVSPAIVWYASLRAKGRTSAVSAPLHMGRLAFLVGSNVLALGLAVAYKATTTQRTTILVGLLWRIRYATEGATAVAFGSYGVGLPVRVADALRFHLDSAVLALSLLVGLVVWLYFSNVFDGRALRAVGSGNWLWTVLAGLVAFAAGYGVILFTFEIGFDTTGMNNRTAQAAALGVALTFVGVIGLCASLIPSERWGWRFFRAATAILVASGTLLVNTIAAFWVAAAREQEVVIESVRRQFDALAPGTVLLLDGLCRYKGPGVVFEAQWDVAGMLRLVYADTSVRGNVVSPRIEVTPEGVRTILYDDVIHVYPYGEQLLVYHVVRGTVLALASEDTARHYFSMLSDRGESCPPGEEGYGVRIF